MLKNQLLSLRELACIWFVDFPLLLLIFFFLFNFFRLISMYVCMECRYAHRTVRFGTKYSILGDPAIPVYCLIGKKTLQRSDGLTRYVECPNRQLHYEWHQSQSHFDQSIPLLVTAPPQLSFPKRGPSSNSPETLPPTNQQYDMNTLAIECYYLPTESLLCFSLIWLANSPVFSILEHVKSASLGWPVDLRWWK